MRPEAVSTILQTRPWRNVTFFASDGSTVTVRHPETVAINQAARTLVVVDDDGGVHVLDVALISRYSTDPPQPAGKIMGSDEPR